MNLSLLFFLPVVAFIAWMFWRSRPEIKPDALRDALKSGRAVLVDVRESSEWASGTVRTAALLPLSDLRGARRQWGAFLDQHRHRQLLLYCQSGARSASAAAQLRREGFDARNAGSIAFLDRVNEPVQPQRRA